MMPETTGAAKMPIQENLKSLEELELERKQAEIDKLHSERRQIEKLVNQKWYFSDLGIKTMALIVATALIVTWAVSVLIPLAQINNELAEAKNKLAETKAEQALSERAKAESLLNEAKAKERLLQSKVQMITARLDSATQRQKLELRSVTDALEKEKAEKQIDQKRIGQLRTLISSLETGLNRTENDKEQIREIVEQYSILMIELPLNISPVTIFVDDSSYGEQKRIPLPYGKHKIRIESEYGIVEREIAIPDKKILPIGKFDFENQKK